MNEDHVNRPRLAELDALPGRIDPASKPRGRPAAHELLQVVRVQLHHARRFFHADVVDRQRRDIELRSRFGRSSGQQR